MSRQSFGQTLRAYRQNLTGLSQSKLAEAAGFDHSYVSRLESDQRQPTRDALDALVRAGGFTPEQGDELRMAAGFMPDGSAALYTYAEAARLDRALVTCTDPQARTDALAAIRLLAKALGDTTL